MRAQDLLHIPGWPDCLKGALEGIPSSISSSNDSNNRKRIMKTIKSWFSKITKGAMAQTAALVIILVSCSMVFAACSNLADTAQNQPATTSRAYIEQTQEQPGDADPEPYEWFY